MPAIKYKRSWGIWIVLLAGALAAILLWWYCECQIERLRSGTLMFFILPFISLTIHSCSK